MNGIFNLINALKGNGGSLNNIEFGEYMYNQNNLNNYIQNNNFNNQNNNKTIMSAYPYGEFPYQYTKQGQEMMKQKYLNQFKQNMAYGNPAFYNQVNNNQQNLYPNYNASFYDNSAYNNAYTNNYNNNFPNYNFQQNNAFTQQQMPTGSGGGLDINTILPLFTSLKGGNNSEMFKKLLPLISNRGNISTNELLNMLTKSGVGGTVRKSDFEENIPSKPLSERNIDDFRKIN